MGKGIESGSGLEATPAKDLTFDSFITLTEEAAKAVGKEKQELIDLLQKMGFGADTDTVDGISTFIAHQKWSQEAMVGGALRDAVDAWFYDNSPRP